MENKDRQFISDRLAGGEKHDTIAHALVLRRALEEVEQVAGEIAGRERAGQLWQEYAYYCLLAPRPEPVKIRDENGVELWQQSDRQRYKVLCKDLAQFAKDYRLNFRELEAVATGAQYEHKGWISEGNSGYLYDQTRSAPPPNPRIAASEAADAAQYTAAREKKVKRMSGYVPSPEPITYTPAK